MSQQNPDIGPTTQWEYAVLRSKIVKQFGDQTEYDCRVRYMPLGLAGYKYIPPPATRDLSGINACWDAMAQLGKAGWELVSMQTSTRIGGGENYNPVWGGDLYLGDMIAAFKRPLIEGRAVDSLTPPRKRQKRSNGPSANLR